jgi:hypothetical protein
MRLFNRQSQNIHSSLLGIAAMTLFQLLILFAIGAAVVRYLEWSSDAAQAEFIREIEATFNSSHSRESSTAAQPVERRTSCNRKG